MSSKATNLKVTFKEVPVSEIWAIASENASRSSWAEERGQVAGSNLELIASIADKGFLSQQGVVGLYPLSKEEQETALKDMEAYLEKLTKGATVTVLDVKHTIKAEDRRDAFMLAHADKTGALIAPKYGVVFAFRRTTVLTDANALRLKMGKKAIDVLPCEIGSYSDPEDRYERNTLENYAKNTGVMIPHAKDTMLRVFAICANPRTGSTRSSLKRNGFKEGLAQKYSALYEAHNRFKSLKLKELALEGDSSKLPLSKLTYKDFNEIYKAKNKDVASAILEKKVKGSGVSGPKPLDKKTASEFFRTSSIELIQLVMATFDNVNDWADLHGMLTNHHEKLNASFRKVLGEDTVDKLLAKAYEKHGIAESEETSEDTAD